MARKGQKFKQWSAEEKLEIIKPAINMEKSISQISKELNMNVGLLSTWKKEYMDKGIEGLIPKRKPGNALAKYSSKKFLTKEEQLEYENMKLRIENEMLKKGFLMKEDGTYVKFMK